MLEKYPADVKVVFKNFPLNTHKFARKAATAALAANMEGKFWEFHDKLFQNSSNLNDETIKQIAGELNLDPEKLTKDMQNPAIQELINRDIKEGGQAGVTGTPAIFVNGRLLKKRSFEGFQTMIDAELKKAGSIGDKSTSAEEPEKAETPQKP